jgi:Lipocalin-like domain
MILFLPQMRERYPQPVKVYKRLEMNKILLLGLVSASMTLAQGTISGTVYANNVKGVIVLACPLDATLQDCDFQKSQYTQIQQSGTSASYTVTNLEASQYLVLAWRDTNSSGNLEEGQDEIAFYATSDGQPSYLTPPMENIDLRLTVTTVTAPAHPLAINPLTSQPFENSSIVGTWENVGSSGIDFVDASGNYVGDGGGDADSFEFRADGSFTRASYTESCLYNSCLTVFQYDEGTYTLNGSQLTLSARRHYRTWQSGVPEEDDYSDVVEVWAIRLEQDPSTGRDLLLIDTDFADDDPLWTLSKSE